MKKIIILFTSTAPETNEFNGYWKICADTNHDCFEKVKESQSEISFQTGDWFLTALDGNKFSTSIDWLYDKIADKVHQISKSIDGQKEICVLLHSDDEGELDDLKDAFTDSDLIKLFIYCSFNEIWEDILFFRDKQTKQGINLFLLILWERINGKPFSRKPNDPLFALYHTCNNAISSIRKNARACWVKYPHCSLDKLLSKIEKELAKIDEMNLYLQADVKMQGLIQKDADKINSILSDIKINFSNFSTKINDGENTINSAINLTKELLKIPKILFKKMEASNGEKCFNN
jgi:hypothetical protein